jgi:hypothetical protein
MLGETLKINYRYSLFEIHKELPWPVQAIKLIGKSALVELFRFQYIFPGEGGEHHNFGYTPEYGR